MNNHLFGFIAATALFTYLFGWTGLLIAFLFGLASCCGNECKQNRSQKSKPFPFFLWSDSDTK